MMCIGGENTFKNQFECREIVIGTVQRLIHKVFGRLVIHVRQTIDKGFKQFMQHEGVARVIQLSNASTPVSHIINNVRTASKIAQLMLQSRGGCVIPSTEEST